MRIAIIDLGTNTFNLLVAAPSQPSSGEKEQLTILHSQDLPVFLGRGGIEQGLITEDAFARGIEALRKHMARAKELDVERISGFGTSMLRNARNGKAFVATVKQELGLDITIVPGDEEAGLILDGVRQAATFGAKPSLVMDIGGGSIEFILATDKALMWKRSFELGVTRLRERFSPTDPLSLEEQIRIGEHLDARLEPLWAVMERHWPTTLIGSAGSFDTLATMLAHERGTTLTAADLTLSWSDTEFNELKDRLMAMSRADRLKVPGLPEHRVDTICLALIAIERILMHDVTELHWSRFALKEGAAARMLLPAR